MTDDSRSDTDSADDEEEEEEEVVEEDKDLLIRIKKSEWEIFGMPGVQSEFSCKMLLPESCLDNRTFLKQI